MVVRYGRKADPALQGKPAKRMDKKKRKRLRRQKNESRKKNRR